MNLGRWFALSGVVPLVRSRVQASSSSKASNPGEHETESLTNKLGD